MNVVSRFLLLVSLICLPPCAQAQRPPSVNGWSKLENCALIPATFNDGDSFHVRSAGKEFIFRLYFVDTPEAESDLAQRTDEQAKYFGISDSECVKLGKDAAVFTAKKLSGAFTVYTRWEDARGRSQLPRYFALVFIGSEDLAELLVRNGLARIYGVKTPLPGGKDSRAYLVHLAALENQAKHEKLGGWKTENSGNGPTPGSFDDFFHKKPAAQ